METAGDAPPPTLEGVEGWLLFLCVQLVLVMPAICLFSLYRLLAQALRLEPALRHLRYFLFTDALLYAVLAAVGIRAGWLLLKPDRRGLRWARGAYAGSFLVYIAPIGLASLFRLSASSQEQLQVSIRDGALRTLIGVVVWLVYLERSKRVKATYRASAIAAHALDALVAYRAPGLAAVRKMLATFQTNRPGVVPTIRLRNAMAEATTWYIAAEGE